MVTDPFRDRLELLIVGGLTVDHFADGSVAPGGSALHAARAMALDGRRVGVVTLAGGEAAASDGLRELAALGEVQVERAKRTIGFDHAEPGEPGGRRRLTFRGGAGLLSSAPRTISPAAVLYAPVADELVPGLGGQLYPGVPSGAILQGWLRFLDPGRPVSQVRLGSLPDALIARLAGCQLLVASVEDLAAHGPTPPAQLDALRAVFGQGPILALTAGVEGAWIQLPGGSRHRVRPPRILSGVSSVGAGDAFAASLLAALSRGVAPLSAAADAASLVAELLAERTGRAVYLVGDVHGMRDQLQALLRGAGLVDADGHWRGGRDELWAAGDLVDRGPDGIGVVQLLMDLEAEAAAAGGRVGSVLGNHELLLLAAANLGTAAGPGGTFTSDWLANGGRPSDLRRLSERHADWLRSRPALARLGPALVLHADAPWYLTLGASVSEANDRVRALLARPDAEPWDAAIGGLSERRAFIRDPSTVSAMLGRFGGQMLAHGHTPIASLLGDPAANSSHAHVYADGRAVALDGALAAGMPGFLHRLPRG